ncbi:MULTISPECIES: HAMP domain-containing sensor histidine kinase [unclassified Thermosynechococcus]|uniref:GAF domain-containing sensor histidine kinase n=1 Tax=unclassified Thermosynechococcus TaxID=2622553 RepID=UPI00198020BD|nr:MULTISPECIES: HAMP domain-containing sensor histidine kinase [unclassified Thermosynechococcus]MDR5639775.1 HAMP domain-containing sensor histidine kinase [Thermosynechococcus sp. PP42]MDR7921305.1 HAMP domain-containing sensor histidine kinase [Thermosynechococcus sp. HY213]QSF49976.1 HAMP domain-containing histidine kinase [Thermosynechococcus sp. TA-1]WKT82023.1 HAMP domain-containing sensor histidine kinase [Thermosynechococcus sp. PP45]WNC23082.1 HAMP domain-containing sensor histidine
MLWPASEEFAALCRAQLELVVNSLGASSLAVYLSETLNDSPSWSPVAVYPEAAAALSLPIPPTLPPPTQAAETPLSYRPQQVVSSLANQLILPLMYQNWVLGVLVAQRQHRPWLAAEQAQLQQVAQTLAIACVLDQRQQWLSHSPANPLDQQQQRFDDLLHQLRNPVAAIRTFVKLLLKRLEPDHQGRPLAEGIAKETERLMALLEDYRQQRNEIPALTGSQPLPLAGKPLDLAETLSPLITAAQARAEMEGKTFVVERPPQLPPIWLEERVLQEVVGNLLDNAFKYTPKGGTIGLRLTLTPAVLELTVWDTGCGIPLEVQSRLFERGYRGIQADSGIEGSGLGLAIAQDLLRPYGLSLRVTSPYEGDRGTAFTLTIPLPMKVER